MYFSNIAFLGSGTVLDLVFLLGLFGYSYGKPIINRYIWMVVSVISILAYGYGLFVNPYIIYNLLGTIGFDELLGLWLPILPLLFIPYALYQYYSNSEHLWESN